MISLLQRVDINIAGGGKETTPNPLMVQKQGE